ncbi:MAG TPA: hypothetical protein VHE60_19270 [Pyrinomonadaceae bacterium]|nr:hypothetical protein [Pyrinomonadaceae bacterium]
MSTQRDLEAQAGSLETRALSSKTKARTVLRVAGPMLLTTFFLLGALLVGVTLWGRHEVNRFLGRHATIDSEATLLAFKILVRRNMWVAVASLMVGLFYLATSALLTWEFGIRGVLIVLAVSVPVFLTGRSTKKLEARAKSLPCDDEQLEVEYRRVGHAWTSKLFPDF